LCEIVEMGKVHTQLTEATKHTTITPAFLVKVVQDYKQCFGDVQSQNNPLVEWAWYSHMLLPNLYRSFSIKHQQEKSCPQQPTLTLNLQAVQAYSDSESDSESPKTASPSSAHLPHVNFYPRALIQRRRQQVLDFRRRDLTKDLPTNVHLQICTYLTDEDLHTMAAVDVYFKNVVCREEFWKLKFCLIDEHDMPDLEKINSYSGISWRFLYMQKKNMCKVFKKKGNTNYKLRSIQRIVYYTIDIKLHL